jgi:hypothetical protein
VFYCTTYGCNETLFKDSSLSFLRYFEDEINLCNSTPCTLGIVREIKPVSSPFVVVFLAVPRSANVTPSLHIIVSETGTFL